MARVQTIVQLNSALLAELDQEAEATGVSRSAVIRRAIEDHLAAHKVVAIDAAMVNGYQKNPQSGTDEWGSPLEQTRRDTRRTLERLDAEEDGAGLRW